MVVQEPVQAAIWHCLNHYVYSDATFLAERLYAEVATDEALFLLATCYYRAGKPRRAYHLLRNKGCPTPQCRYLLSHCCLEINKLAEAEAAISGNVLHKSRTFDETSNEFGETASFALKLLAHIYSKTERASKASEGFQKCLQLNPFLWSAFEALCSLGEKPDPSKFFQINQQHNLNVCQSPYTVPLSTSVHVSLPNTPQELSPLLSTDLPDSTPIQLAAPLQSTQIPLHTPENVPDYTTPENLANPLSSLSRCNAPKMKVSRLLPKASSNLLSSTTSLSPLTPSFGLLPLDAVSPAPSNGGSSIYAPAPRQVLFCQDRQSTVPKAPSKMEKLNRPAGQTRTRPPVFSISGNTNTTISTPQQQGISNGGGGLRRSSRLFNASSSVKENNKNQGQKKFSGPRAPTKKSRSKNGKSQQELNELNKSEQIDRFESKPSVAMVVHYQTQVASMQKQSADGLMNLLEQIGNAYLALSQYDCKRSIEMFESLPPQHYNTGWVLCQVGRAYFELADYQKAEKVFKEVLQHAPTQVEGMEIYSTTLWHLQREVQLSFLAQELTTLDKHCPQTWCVTGNCFSLQKEHDTAIKFFQRAVQVDPNFAYAYTLLGHEFVLTEELDKALACFRNATRVDSRHYNAWYGIGMIYYKQEKFALAEFHFRKALSINPHSSVLLCHIGVVQHALKKSEAALATLNRAIAADSKNPLCKFHRASILFANDRHKEALHELEELKEIVPKESLVYFLMGKVHKKLGNTHLALMNFSWAMDLDPKGANNQIKEAIDKRYVTEEDDPGAGFDEASCLDDPAECSNSSVMEDDEIQLQAVESDESL